jgi:hypothetical protein
MHVSMMRHHGDVHANLSSPAQREYARACDASPVVVAALTLALFDLPVCILYALREV